MQFQSTPPQHFVQAVSVLCQHDRKFLLVKRANLPFQNWYSFPGGKVESGETALQAAKRELMEETSLIAQDLHHLVTLNLGQKAHHPHDYYLSIYHALSYTGKPVAGDDARAICWMDLQQMEIENVIPSVYEVARHMDRK